MLDEPLTERNARARSEAFIRTIPPVPDRHQGRGIVICGGGPKYFTPAWVCINMLRRLGCSLPIQLWHLGEAECDDRMRALVATLGVECVDARELSRTYPSRILNGWELKPYAIIHSPFREVMLIDADNVPVTNPDFLFDTPQFEETGALFWPDIGRLDASREIWDLCGVAYRDEPEFETGQIVVDKERCWNALSLCMWYNEYSDFYYRHVHGDKETFHLAFRKLDQPYAMPEEGVHHLPATFCQHDFEGRRLWQHRNHDKWDYWGRNHCVPDFWYEDECRAYVKDLRRIWNGRVNGAGRESFGDFVTKVIAEAEPMSQNTEDGNLGFGWIYYGLARNLRPDFVVAIGSCRGFMPFCAARALQDNGHGRVIFIDPSYSGMDDPGWSGKGLWSDPGQVEARFAEFGLTGWITHLKQTSEQAFPHVRELVAGGKLGLVIIDGAHTHANSLQDFELYSSLMSEGFVLFHDATNPACEVSRTVHTLQGRRFQAVTIHRDAGLALVAIDSAPSVESRWSYLCRPSNRGRLILPYAESILRPGDRLLDIYCGYSPLGFLLKDVAILGWDRDGQVIGRLREELPQHRWEQVDELSLPFATFLPTEIDVILGLGLTRGHAHWDTQCVADNVRYLLGRYYPRACLFESAADYYDARILEDLRENLVRLGYSCREDVIQTDLGSFARRKLLVAERPDSGAEG